MFASAADPSADADGLSDVLGAQLAAHGGSASRWRWMRSIRSCGSSCCSESWWAWRVSCRGQVTTIAPVDGDSGRRPWHRLDDDGAGSEFVIADDHRCGRTAAVGELHLRLHRSVVVAAVRGEAGGTERGRDDDRLGPPVTSTTNASRATRVGGEHTLVVAGEQGAIDAEREAHARCRRARREPRRDRRTGPRHRVRSAPSRACRPGTRRSCAGSSRGRGPASARWRTGCRARRRPASTASKWSARLRP